MGRLLSGSPKFYGLTVGAGNIALGGNKLTTTHLLIKQESSGTWATRNLADNAYSHLRTFYLFSTGGIEFETNGSPIRTPSADDNYITFEARDNGVGLVEVARLQGAADPYFQMTLAMRLNPIATGSLPATPVEGMLVYDDTANKLKFYNGSAWETVTSAV